MIVEQIESIYRNKLHPNRIMLEHNEALKYFGRLLMNGNIITYVIDDELFGFIEFWRISYEQFGRICCNWTLAHDEDLLNGEIALITRMWINPDLRNGEVFNTLAFTFLDKNKDAKHFATFQHQKKHKPLQVYSREELIKYFK